MWYSLISFSLCGFSNIHTLIHIHAQSPCLTANVCVRLDSVDFQDRICLYFNDCLFSVWMKSSPNSTCLRTAWPLFSWRPEIDAGRFNMNMPYKYFNSLNESALGFYSHPEHLKLTNSRKLSCRGLFCTFWPLLNCLITSMGWFPERGSPVCPLSSGACMPVHVRVFVRSVCAGALLFVSPHIYNGTRSQWLTHCRTH